MTSDESFQRLWAKALHDYFETTKRSDGDKQILRSIRGPDDLLAWLQSDSQKFAAFREKRAGLRRVLSRIAGPLSLVSDIAGKAIASTPYAPASVMLGAVGLLFRAAEGLTLVYDALENLFERLSAYGPRLEQYVQAPVNEHLQAVAVRILICFLEVITRAENVVKDGRWKKFTGVLFLGGDDKLRSLCLSWIG